MGPWQCRPKSTPLPLHTVSGHSPAPAGELRLKKGREGLDKAVMEEEEQEEEQERHWQ